MLTCSTRATVALGMVTAGLSLATTGAASAFDYSRGTASVQGEQSHGTATEQFGVIPAAADAVGRY
jgi:hypothetical protein